MYKNTKVTVAAPIAGILALATVAFAVPHQAQARNSINHNTRRWWSWRNQQLRQAHCSGGDANVGKGGNANGGSAIA